MDLEDDFGSYMGLHTVSGEGWSIYGSVEEFMKTIMNARATLNKQSSPLVVPTPQGLKLKKR